MGEKVKGFELPDKRVTVKFIKKAKGLAANVKDNHIISGGMLETASRSFCVPTMRSGGLKNVLTKEEKEYLEDGHFRGVDLSVYAEFWKDFAVKISKDGITLDLLNPEDFLKYKLLLAWDKVISPSLETYKRTRRPSYQFYMIMEGEEQKALSKTLNVTKQAWKLYAKVEDNRDILISVLNLMTNKKISTSSTIDFIRTEVEHLVDSKAEEFVAVMEDADFEIKSVIALAENAGFIKKKSGKYETIDGLKLAGKGDIATLSNAVKYLTNPRNAEVLDIIKARLDNNNE